jgi:hypothetical protein
MSSEFVVDPGALAATGGALRAIGAAASASASRIRAVDGPAEPSMAAGVDAVADAWGGAAELLGSTTAVLGILVERAAAGYVATDDAIADGVAAR